MINGTSSLQSQTITFAVAFTPSFNGAIQDHIFSADNLGLSTWDTQSNGTWTWNSTQNAQTPQFGPQGLQGRGRRSETIAGGFRLKDSSGYDVLYNDNQPAVLTYTAYTGDVRFFNSSCSITGSTGTVKLDPVDQYTINITFTLPTNSSTGLQTVTCYWANVVPYTWSVDVMSSNISSLFADGSLSGAVLDAQDNGNGTYTLELSPLAYDFVMDNGFLAAAAAGSLVFVPGVGEVVIAVGGAVVITVAVVAIHDWWVTHKNDVPPNLPRPKNAPTGTVPIDKYPGITGDQIHEIKDNLGLKPADWTGMLPMGM